MAIHLYSQIEFKPMCETAVDRALKWFQRIDCSAFPNQPGGNGSPLPDADLKKSFLYPFSGDSQEPKITLADYIISKNSEGGKPFPINFNKQLDHSQKLLCAFKQTDDINQKKLLAPAVISIILSKIYLDTGSLTCREVETVTLANTIFQPPMKTILNFSRPVDDKDKPGKLPSRIDTLRNLKQLKKRLVDAKKKHGSSKRNHLPVFDDYIATKSYVSEEEPQKTSAFSWFSSTSTTGRDAAKIQEEYIKKAEAMKSDANTAIKKSVECSQKELDEFQNILSDYKGLLPKVKEDFLPAIANLVFNFDDQLKPEQNIKLYEEAVYQAATVIQAIITGVTIEEESLRDEITSLEEHDEIQLGEVAEYDINKIKQIKPIIRDIAIGDIVNVEMKPVYYHIEGLDDIVTRDDREGFRHELEYYKEQRTISEKETEEYRKESEKVQKEISSEFSKDVSKSLEQAISASAGLKASAKYGVTKVEATANASYSRSKSQQEDISTKSTEKIIKTAEKEFNERKRIRLLTDELQTTRETIIRERSTPNNSTGTKPVTVITAWVCCDYEVSIIRYSNALTLIFDIPEPGVWLLEKMQSDNSGLERPITHKITIGNVSEENVRYWAEAYPEAQLPNPPPETVAIPFNINTTPSDSGNVWNAHIETKNLQIPEGYKPTYLYVAEVGTYKSGEHQEWQGCIVSVCGRIAMHVSSLGWSENYYQFNEQESTADYPNGMDISVRLISLHHNIGQVNGQLYCERTEVVVQQWKQGVVQKILEAQKERIEEYERKIALSAMNEEETGLPPYMVRSPIENQKIMQDELSKWCIQAITGRMIDNALVRVVVKGETKHIEPDLSTEHDVQLGLAYLMNDWFEWDGMSHFEQPYFWGRRARWRSRLNINIADKEYQQFLQAGCSTVYLPIKAGAEKHVLSFISKLQENPDDFISIVSGYLSDDPDPDSEEFPHLDVVTQVLQQRKKGYMLGPGTISICNAGALAAASLLLSAKLEQARFRLEQATSDCKIAKEAANKDDAGNEETQALAAARARVASLEQEIVLIEADYIAARDRAVAAVDNKRKAVITYTDEDFLSTRWYPTNDDMGRIIEIEGCDCAIETFTINDAKSIMLTLSEDYTGRGVANGRYRLKGVLVGSPFPVTLPTGKSVVVDDELPKTLSILNSMLS